MNVNSILCNIGKTLLVLILVLITLSIQAHETMRKTSDGTYVINTTTLCKDVHGFKRNATTPVEVYIRKDKVVKVVALQNQESPGYFSKVKKFLLPLFSDVKVSKAKKIVDQNTVDGCTGATFSTHAVQKNIKAALDYYERNK